MAPDRLPWFRFFPQDFLGDGKIRLLSPAEVGIYVRLLCHEWLEGPLPPEPDRLARIAGASIDEMKAAWPAVRECFEETEDGHLVRPDLEEERERALEKREQARRAAKKRWEDADGDADGDASADPDAHADAGADGGAMGDANQNQNQREETETEGEGSSLRSSPSPPPGGDDGRPDQEDGESFDPASWLDRLQDVDSPFASDALPRGVYHLLWRAKTPPPDAPGNDWSMGGDTRRLKNRLDQGWTPFEVGLAMIGLHLLGEEGEIPSRLTSAYPEGSSEWEGPELWHRARNRGRAWLGGQSDPSETLDRLEEQGIDLSDIRDEEAEDGR